MIRMDEHTMPLGLQLLMHAALLTFCCLLIACERDAKSAEPGSTKARPPLSTQSLSVGIFTFDVPSDWEVISGSDERAARKEVAAGVQQMIDSYQSSSGPDQEFLGIQAFRAIKMPDDAGWFIAHTIRIPPQKDYLVAMEADQKQKISWGKKKGIVTLVNEHGRMRIGEADVLKTDTEMRGGVRSIGIYYWSSSEPNLVGTISVVINPGKYGSMQSHLERTFASIQINLEAAM